MRGGATLSLTRIRLTLTLSLVRQQQEEEDAAARAIARSAEKAEQGEGGDAESKRKAQRDRWDSAVALFVEFSSAKERNSLELGEQLVRSLLHVRHTDRARTPD